MSDEEYVYSQDESIKNWLKRTQRKGPFYLFSVEEQNYYNYVAGGTQNMIGKRYNVIWKEKGKTKFGSFYDGMHTRYGVICNAHLTGTEAVGLWQLKPGTVSMEALEALQRVAKGETVFSSKENEFFDPSNLIDLKS